MRLFQRPVGRLDREVRPRAGGGLAHRLPEEPAQQRLGHVLAAHQEMPQGLALPQNLR